MSREPMLCTLYEVEDRCVFICTSEKSFAFFLSNPADSRHAIRIDRVVRSLHFLQKGQGMNNGQKLSDIVRASFQGAYAKDFGLGCCQYTPILHRAGIATTGCIH